MRRRPQRHLIVEMLSILGSAVVAIAAMNDTAHAEYREVSSPEVDEAASESSAETAEPAPKVEPAVYTALGLMGFFAAQKVMPGVGLRVGETWGARLETSLLWTTERAPDVDATFLGSQFGLYFEATPLRGKSYDLNLGIGTDVYYLWGIYSDFWELSLSAEVNGSYWFSERFGGLLGVRGYPLASNGLELGTERDGSSGIPVLAFAAVQWRTR